VIAGHFGLAAAVKARVPTTPLWALMLATQWLDIVFVPLVSVGIERLETAPGAKPGAYGSLIIHADYTHSLVGAIALSALLGALFALRYGKRSGLVLAAVAFSHWILDVPLHRGDMPILPASAGALPRLGFGLWDYPVLSALLELAIVAVGAAMYWSAASRLDPDDDAVRRRAKVCGAGVLGGCLLTLALSVVGH
jgi:membrane-bound metal-dependent hydrolase YbcI (DUF457 family)